MSHGEQTGNHRESDLEAVTHREPKAATHREPEAATDDGRGARAR